MPKKISIFSSIQGHWSIALALEEILSSEFEVNLNQYHGLDFQSYKLIYRYAPGLFGPMYELGRLSFVQNNIHKYNQQTYKQKILADIAEQQPDILISTWFSLNQILGDYCQQHEKPFVNVVANPRTIHPLEASSEYTNLVFDKSAKFACLVEGITESSLFEVGWFVQQKFQPPQNQDQLRISLQIKPNLLTILFQNGSDGGQKSLSMLRYLAQILPQKTAVHIIFACGNNQALLKKANSFKALFSKPIKFEVIPFTPNIHLYMQAADLVVGKAGPNSLFESIATNTPFFATYHISGQEDGNLDIIHDYNIGYVEEKVNQAARQLAQIIIQPTLLDKFNPGISNLRQYNNQAGPKLLKILKKL